MVSLHAAAPVWLSDIGVSPIVAGNGEGCRCGCQHASSGRWLIWVWSRAQEAHPIPWYASITWDQCKYCSNTYIFSLGVLTLQAHIRHDPPQMASVAEDQPMYKPSPISYLQRSYTWDHGERPICFLICADLLCPRIKMVKELLRDVGCIPRHGYHGADAWNTCQLLVKGLRQWLRSYSVFPWNDKHMLFFKFCDLQKTPGLHNCLHECPFEPMDLVHTDWSETRDLPL